MALEKLRLVGVAGYPSVLRDIHRRSSAKLGEENAIEPRRPGARV